ncbi:hypothetical protein D5W64_12460 [Salmonella enterica subsp. enterica serovar Saintpaul]|nr:hypothetical protein [Salmonella enterica subsp. enterica serovar Saintpaul]
MTPLETVALGFAITAYIVIGLRNLGKYFWALGTAHNGYRKPETVWLEIGWSLLLILGWPLIKLFFYSLWLVDRFTPKKPDPLYTKVDGGGKYKCYGIAHGKDKYEGVVVIVYQNVDTKTVYITSEDDFKKSMKLLKK